MAKTITSTQLQAYTRNFENAESLDDLHHAFFNELEYLGSQHQEADVSIQISKSDGMDLLTNHVHQYHGVDQDLAETILTEQLKKNEDISYEILVMHYVNDLDQQAGLYQDADDEL